MNAVLKIFLSMSFSGGLLILALLWGKRFLKDKISRQWQYYIWLAVILRLLIPFGPEVNLLRKTYQTFDRAITRAASLPSQRSVINIPADSIAPAVGLEQSNENVNNPSEDLTAIRPLQDIGTLLTNHVWVIWLVAALGLLIRKITIYQGFIRYVKAGSTPVSDLELLDRLSIAAERAGIQKQAELCVNPLISSPLLTGFFNPCVVLPDADIPEKNFLYIVLHELTHYKRRDMFYKWLVQVTVCLHWFNPLVHLMSREITKACEFSCDEAVLVKMGCNNAQDYGKTLLDAMAAVGRYKENPGAVTLSENKQLLKERLGAIMKFKEKSKAVKLLTAMLTLCVILGAAFAGVYSPGTAHAKALHVTPPDTAGSPREDDWRQDTRREEDASNDRFDAPDGQLANDTSSDIEQYYEAGSLPLFEIAFQRLDEKTQKMWLEKTYANGEFAFFSVAVRRLGRNSSLFADFAEKAYADEEIAFFSILADCMNQAELELWLDRALEDGKWSFQSVLFDRLDKSDEFDELKDEREAAQAAEYEAVGVTMDGRNYYYQGQLVNIFLDIRADESFYTLDMNPAGTVNIKIIRDADDKITGVVYMTETEVTELLGDMQK